MPSWDVKKLERIIQELRTRGGDSARIEVKSALGGCPDVAPTLSAFANMPSGGVLILGLAEPNFEAVGITDVAELEAAVAAIARTAVSPPPTCTFTTLTRNKKDVLICEVDGLSLAHRPARTKGKAYLRQSDGDYELSNQELEQIELLKLQGRQRTYPDLTPIVGTSHQDLDPDLLSAFMHTARTSSPRLATLDTETLLEWTNVTTTDGNLTLAACYAMAKYPQRWLPTLAITAAVQLDEQAPGRTFDLVHLDGPLPDLLTAAMAWVQRNTGGTIAYNTDGHGVDQPAIPLVAVREIIANALVHRNLDPVTDSKRIEIRIRDGRLIVHNPGGLWGVTQNQLGAPGCKSAVNQVLYDMCKRVRMPDGLRVIEGEGGGIREAQRALRAAGLREPRFLDSGVGFTAWLSQQSLVSNEDAKWLPTFEKCTSLSSIQRAILVALRDGRTFSNQELRHEFGPLDSREVQQMMQGLVDSGLVVMTGARRSARYSFEGTERTEMPPMDTGDVLDRETQILELLATHDTISELAKVTGLTRKQVRYSLDKLRQDGRVELSNNAGRGASYRCVH